MSNKTLRTFIVASLALITLGIIMPCTVGFLRDFGSLGFRADYNGRIIAIEVGSPAANAGINPGDRIDLYATAPRFRVYAAAQAPRPNPGERVELVLHTNAGDRNIALIARAAPLSEAERISMLLRLLEVFVYVAVGGALVLLRPSPATWGFYLACLGINQVPPEALGAFAWPWSLIAHIIGHLMLAAGTVGFVIFGLRFPSHEAVGWRATIERMSWAIFLVSAALLLSVDLRPVVFGLPSQSFDTLAIAWESVMGLAVMSFLLITYAHATPEDRQRIRWVIVGFAVGIGAAILSGFIGFGVAERESAVVGNWLHLLTITVPLTVAYAVVKHQVLDVRFALSRALVYGVMTSGVVAAFGVIDWFFSRVIASRQIATYAEIAASIGLGFGLHRVERSVDRFIDSVFFRNRHIAEQQLTRIAEALPHARSLSAIDRLLATEPAETLHLSSAAVYRRDDQNTFRCVYAIGWPAQSPVFDSDDPLFLQLSAELRPLQLSDLRWSPSGLPVGDAKPDVAVPIAVRGRLFGASFYAGPVSGAAIDPDLVDLLSKMANGAANAYDRLEVESLHERLRNLEMQLGSPARS